MTSATQSNSSGWNLSRATMPAAIRALESCGDLMQKRIAATKGSSPIHIEVATNDDDWNKATDLVVISFRAMRLGVRVRRNDNLYNHAESFTIRTHTRSGNPKSELLKFRQGWGDFMLYAWASPDGANLDAGAVIDLRVWRQHEFSVPVLEWSNGGRSGGHDLSAFNSYRFADFPDELLVYRFDNRLGLF